MFSMLPRTLETGAVYVIDRSEYIATRETGKLVFMIHWADGETAGKAAPFDFQANDYPDQLTVVYRGEGKFEQKQSSVLPQVYQVGKQYTFKVWRESGSQGLLLRDEANGLTHSNMRIPGAGQLKRFAEIECIVTAVSEDGLQLSYQGARRVVAKGGYTLQTLLQTERLCNEPWIRVARRVMDYEVLGEARDVADRGDGRWVVMALQTLVRFMPQWLSEAPGRRRVWVERLGYTIRTVVESSAYAAAFDYNRSRLRSQRHELGRGLEQLEYIGEAAGLVASGKAEDMIDHTLETMRRTGWVYEPNQRMGVLMQVLAMAPGLGHSHTGDVFEIIRTRRNNHDFMSIFGDAFKIMLKTYIETERTAPDPMARGSLRELAEAIAIELLLTADEEFELWDTHRGVLYTVAALLTGHSGEAPVRKAMLTYCGLNDTPLEFGWEDLHDINRVCYRLLATGRDMVGAGIDAVFEGESIRLRVDNRCLWLQPAADELIVRTELAGTLAADMSFAVQLPERLREKGYADSINLSHHRLMWEQIRAGLESTEARPASRPKNDIRELQKGDTVGIYVTGPNAMERYEFDCRSADGRYCGVLAIRDIVPYPVNCTLHRMLFYDGQQPLLLRAIATEQFPDGRWRFSLRRAIMDANYRDACHDRNEGNRILAKITDVGGIQYKATTQLGYGILLSKRDTQTQLNLGDVVMVRVDSVNYRPEDWKLYINCSWLETVTDAEGDPDISAMLDMPGWDYGAQALGELLRDQYESMTADQVPEEPADCRAAGETREELYLGPEAVANLSFLLEQCASLQRDNLRQSYTLINLALLLADMSGDRGRCESLEIQLRVLEMLSAFSVDGKVDLESVTRLVERGRRMAGTSALLRSRLKEVALLASLDNQQFLRRTQEWAQRGADEHTHKLAQLATAYNALEGLGAPDIRDSIRHRIHTLLSLPRVESKQRRLTVSEDLYHEFKTSAIYPADNHMKPDEYRQGQVIARTVASFLNTEGGTLYLGVDNAGNLIGLDNDFRYISHTQAGDYDIRETLDRYNLYLQKSLRRYLGTTVDGLSLVPDFIDLQYEQVDSLWICHITVRPFTGRAVLLKPDDKLYLRRIGETVEVRDATEKRRFIERRDGRV